MPQSELMIQLQNRSQFHVGIIGLGYVGLPLAMVFHEAGFHVTGFDVDEHKIQSLHDGYCYIHHIGADQVIAACRAGTFRPTSDFNLLAEMDAILICVPTPLDSKRQPDLSYVENTAREIALHLRPGQLIVLESTTYPGTTDEVLIPILETSGIACREQARLGQAAAAGSSSVTSVAMAPGNRVYVAYSPEREDPGNKQFTTRMIPKVVGGADAASAQFATNLYASAFDRVIPVSSARAAEMAKILENTYRCVNIALVNELNLLCRRMGLDLHEIIEAAASKPFGFQPFYPGPGMGGHCIPIDPFYLSWKARDYDFTTRFIELAGEINVAMPYRVVEVIQDALDQHQLSLRGSRLLILGIAYKKDIDDMRESPALKVMDLLMRHGARLDYYDPYCPEIRPSRHYDFSMASIDFQPRQAAEYSAVIIMTDHSNLDYAAIAQHARLLVDTRNATRGLSLSQIVRL